MALVIHMPEERFEMSVGDKGRYVTFQIGKGNRKEVLNLTGYNGYVSFMYQDAAPHVTRCAPIIAVSGLLVYTFRGDELPTKGECLMQATIQLADWFIGGAPGRAFFKSSSDMVRIQVLQVAA